MNTNFPQFVLLFVLTLTNMTLFAQDTKEAVILYNTQPVRAEITTDGQVNRIIREEPDYLKGFQLKIQDYGQFIEKQSEPLVNAPKSQPYAIFASDYKLVKFETNHATLSDDAIDVLEAIVVNMRSTPELRIVLVSLSKLDNSLVTKNRLNSIRSYFKIRGIDTSRILIESLLGEIDVDEIKIHHLK